MSRRGETSDGSGALRFIRQFDREVPQPARVRRRRGRAEARPGVHTDVVVIAAGGKERRSGAVARGDVETERAVVERLRRGDVGDAKVDVADLRFVWQP